MHYHELVLVFCGDYVNNDMQWKNQPVVPLRVGRISEAPEFRRGRISEAPIARVTLRDSALPGRATSRARRTRGARAQQCADSSHDV